MYGNRNASGQYPFATPAPEGGLYGVGRFAYSTNQFSSSLTITTASVTSGSWADTGYNSDLSASAAAGQIKKFTLNALGPVSGTLDPDGVRAFVLVSGSSISGSIITVADNFQAYTSFTSGTTLTFYVTASTAEIAETGPYTLYYNKKPIISI